MKIRKEKGIRWTNFMAEEFNAILE